jgi:hypothetical protein
MWPVEPPFAPAASIGGPWRASEDFFFFAVELLIVPLAFIAALPIGFGLGFGFAVWAPAAAVVAAMARKSAVAWIVRVVM